LFAVEDAAKISEVGVLDVAAFDAEDDLFGFVAGVVVEVEAAIDAFLYASAIFHYKTVGTRWSDVAHWLHSNC
jgi:hypothetical protein